MGVFVTPIPMGISGITDKPVVLLSATTYTLVINSLILCNLSTNSIRVNLRRTYTPSSSNPTTVTYLVKNLEIPINAIDKEQKGSLDIVKYLGRELFLAPTDTIICYTGGINQIVDCSLDYMILNDTNYP